jgi:hypothetical protein
LYRFHNQTARRCLFTLRENKRFSLRAVRNQNGNRIIQPQNMAVPAEFAGFSVSGKVHSPCRTQWQMHFAPIVGAGAARLCYFTTSSPGEE